MERTNYKEHHEVKDRVPKVQEEEVKNIHASKQPQENLDNTATSDQSKQAKSEDECASNKIQNNKNVVTAITEESSENDKVMASSTDEVRQVEGQGDSCENVLDVDDTLTVTTQKFYESRGSVPNESGNSSTNLGKETTNNEPDMTVIQVITKASDQDIKENKKLSTDENYEEEKELTLEKTAHDEMKLGVIQSVVTPSDRDIEENENPGTDEKSKQKKEPTNSDAETSVKNSASLNTELCVSENKFDTLCENGDQQPGYPCANPNQAVINETAFDQGQVFLQTSFATADDLEQTVRNLDQNQNQDELKQKSTDDTLVDVKSEKPWSDDQYKSNPKMTETTVQPQSDHTRTEDLVADSSQIGAQEKNSESASRCTSPQLETNSSQNNKTVAVPCEEASQLQLKDSGSCSVTVEVKSNETKTVDSMPSRDINSENKLIKALRFSCKLSSGHLFEGFDIKGVMSIHLMRSLSPGVVTVAELVRKLVLLTELDLSGNLLGPQGFRVICLALRRNTTLKCLNLANNLADTDSSVST